MTRRRVCTLLSLLACGFTCGCAAPAEPVAEHPFLRRFEAARAFVPDDMDSVWLADVDDTSDPGPGMRRARRLELRCGRDHEFESWPGWGHQQTFDGVLIEDYGLASVPVGRRAELGEPWQPIDGASTWYRPERRVGLGQLVPATWATVVDDRFVVIADGEELLRKALRRPRGPIFDEFRAAIDVPPDTIGFGVRAQ